jgi:hypothetical protein
MPLSSAGIHRERRGAAPVPAAALAPRLAKPRRLVYFLAPPPVRTGVSGCCRSSVVEHSLGKGEVHSSILCGSTIKAAETREFLDLPEPQSSPLAGDYLPGAATFGIRGKEP